MQIAVFVNKKELDESIPGLGHSGKALHVFVLLSFFLLLLISNRSFQVHSQCSCILFSPGSYMDFVCLVPKVYRGFGYSI